MVNDQTPQMWMEMALVKPERRDCRVGVMLTQGEREELENIAEAEACSVFGAAAIAPG